MREEFSYNPDNKPQRGENSLLWGISPRHDVASSYNAVSYKERR